MRRLVMGRSIVLGDNQFIQLPDAENK